MGCELANQSIDEEAEEEFDPYLFISRLPRNDKVTSSFEAAIRNRLPKRNPSSIGSRKISLVLDLDETLVHCSTDPNDGYDFEFPVHFCGVDYTVYARKRPYLNQFLQAVSSRFEVIVFTASHKAYAQGVLDFLDPNGDLIDHRLYRDSCLLVEGVYIKDLAIL